MTHRRTTLCLLVCGQEHTGGKKVYGLIAQERKVSRLSCVRNLWINWIESQMYGVFLPRYNKHVSTEKPVILHL